MIFLFLFLPICLLLLFGIMPIIMLGYYSLTNWDGVTQGKEWVGWANYQKIIQDPTYFSALKNNLYYFCSGSIQLVLALFLATLLSTKTVGKTLFKAVFVFPILISSVAITMIFRLFFEPAGLLDQLLGWLHLSKFQHYWLGDPRIVNYSLAFISLWRHLGTSFLLFFAAIQSIPEIYFKAAMLEGASLWQQTRWIIWPNIQTTLRLNAILLIIGAISVFDIPFIMTNGSNGTTTLLVQIMKVSFNQKKVGLASALAVIISLLMISLSVLQQKIKKRGQS